MTEPAGPSQDRFTADEGTLFLLGNGPSLAEIDLKALSAFPTLGMNAAYRFWRRIGWRPRYYACLDTVVGLSHREAIAELIAETGEKAIRRFILRENLVHALGDAARTDRVVNFDALRAFRPMLRPNPITTGSHAALWAASEGYRKIVLLGIDGNYVERVEGAKARDGIELEIVEEKENPNYFFEGYQQKGDRFNIPNPRPGLHVEAWEIAAAALRRENIAVVNGNPQSAVRFFPFVGARELVERGTAMTDASTCEAPSAAAAARAREAQEGTSVNGGRLNDFLQRQRKALFIGLALTLAAGVGVALTAPSWTGALAGLFALALFAGLFVLLLFVRHAVSWHMARLEQRIAALEAAAADRDRVAAK